VADEKNWQTVEEFIKQYKPVDEAMKELEEMRTSAALTTGAPANKLPTIFDDDPVYGSSAKNDKKLPPLAVGLLTAYAFIVGTLGGNIFVGMIGATFYPIISLLQNIIYSLDARAIIINENQHLIDTITSEKIIEERNEHPESTAQLTDLQIAKMLAEKQGGIKTLWQKEFERKYITPVFIELNKDPEHALYQLLQSEFYKAYFNKVVASGVKELAREASAEKWKNRAPFYVENNSSALSNKQQAYLAGALINIFKQLKKTLCKEFESNEQELFFDVALIGYICFMADLFTPIQYLGTNFLETYVHYIFEVKLMGTKVSIFHNITEDQPITKNKEFMGMFNNAYKAFISSLPNFYAEFKEPKDFINAYSQLLLRFLFEDGLLNTQTAEDPVLLNEATRLTASILPLCERALDAHYLPAFYTSLPEGQ